MGAWVVPECCVQFPMFLCDGRAKSCASRGWVGSKSFVRSEDVPYFGANPATSGKVYFDERMKVLSYEQSLAYWPHDGYHY